MPVPAMEEPNNCRSWGLARFADAVIGSAEFRGLVGLPSGPDEAVARFVFGERLTHAKSGHAWTLAEMQELRHYAQVYDDAERPFGKYLDNNACYRPRGTVIVAVARIVSGSELDNPGPDKTGLTDVHDRQWQNIVTPMMDGIPVWLTANGGPYPVTTYDCTADFTTKDVNAASHGVWQRTEYTFVYGGSR